MTATNEATKVVGKDSVAPAKTNTCDGPWGGTETEEMSEAVRWSELPGVYVPAPSGGPASKVFTHATCGVTFTKISIYHTDRRRPKPGAKPVGRTTTLIAFPKEVHPSEDVSKPCLETKTFPTHAGGSALCEKTDEASNEGPEVA